MADLETKRIINLAEETAPSEGDYLVVDNANNGTKKILFENTLDKTFSQTGKAAESRETGIALENINNNIESISESVFIIKTTPEVFIPFDANNGDSITIKTVSGNVFAGQTQIGFYNENKTAVANLNVSSTYGYERTVNVSLSSKAYYIKTIASDWAGEELYITNNSNVECEKIREYSQLVKAKIDYSLYETVDQSLNFINKQYIPLNVGVGDTVDLTPTSSAQRAYVILPVKSGDSFVVTGSGGSAPRLWGFTDKNYKLLSVANSGASGSNLQLTAKQDGYLIVNHSNTQPYSLVSTQLIKALSEKSIKQLIDTENDPIIVDANGNGDYTSFTLACKENYSNRKDIVVKAGTYNIVSEYVAIWGQTAVDNMADADGETFDGWQYGVKMNGRKFTFESGAKLVCDWSGHTVDGTHRFSPLRVEMDVEIIGLDLDCTATFYAIHDDYGNNNKEYTNIYRYCKVIGHSLNNVNCIGGGCKKYSRHIIDNCYFDNNTEVSTAVRYHNVNEDGAVPEIYVSNSYFNTYFRANWYGSQTSKMRVYVNNCYAKKIYKSEESSSYTTDNVEMYKWNNTETNPD